MRKIVATITMMVLVLAGTFSVPVMVDAETTSGVTDTIQYVEYEYETFSSLIGKTAPAYAGSEYGYVFAGWYKEKSENNPITVVGDVESGTKVYAKFVPSYVMGVKCQNHTNTTTDGNATKIRVVSSIDSTKYKAVGMIVDKITLDENGNCQSVTNIYNNTVKAYSGKLNVYSSATKYVQYEAKDVFGSVSKYYIAANLSGITAYDMIICVQPYWETLDGTKVVGLSRYVRVNDGLQGYVSIPINLNSATEVAAGLVSVDYSSLGDNVESVTVEGGTVFGEIAANVDAKNKVVRCVGNVSDISKNVQSNDILVNIRIKLSEVPNRSYDGTFYSFKVTGESFTDIDESELNGYDVWNVQY